MVLFVYGLDMYISEIQMIDILNKVIYVNGCVMTLISVIMWLANEWCPWQSTNKMDKMFSVLFKLLITNLALFGSIRIWMGW